MSTIKAPMFASVEELVNRDTITVDEELNYMLTPRWLSHKIAKDAETQARWRKWQHRIKSSQKAKADKLAAMREVRLTHRNKLEQSRKGSCH